LLYNSVARYTEHFTIKRDVKGALDVLVIGASQTGKSAAGELYRE